MNIQVLSTRTRLPFPTVHHEGRTWVVAEEGEEYILELCNSKPVRVEVVLTVDGLSVMTGASGTTSERGYIVPGWGKLEVPGWRRDNAEVAAFRFGSKGTSYGQLSGHGDKNCGVIGMVTYLEQTMVYREVPVIREVIREVPIYVSRPRYWWGHHVTCNSPMGYSGAEDVSCSAEPEPMRATKGICRGLTTASASNALLSSSSPSFDLGTGYGRALESKVHSTYFQRSSEVPFESLVLWYASREALIVAGIPVENIHAPVQQPSPWPGCVAPTGWSRAG